MKYGIKKINANSISLWTTTQEWLSSRFVGLSANHAAKEWKTEKGAQRVANRIGGEVFTITNLMNY